MNIKKGKNYRKQEYCNDRSLLAPLESAYSLVWRGVENSADLFVSDMILCNVPVF